MNATARRNEPCPCGSGKRFKHCCGVAGNEAVVPPSALHLRELADRALTLHQRGQITQAESLYRQVLAANPYHFDALQLLGVIRHQRGAFAEAELLIRRALDLKPHVAMVHNNLGSVLQAQGRIDEAMAAFRRAVDYDPKDAYALNNLGNILGDLQRHEEAIGFFRRAIKIKPTFADAHNNLGSAYKDLSRWDDAEKEFHRALELDPNSVDTHINLGNLQHILGRLDEARASALAALRLAPDSPTAQFNLSLVQLTEGDFAAGWQGYEQRWATALHAVRPQFSQPYWSGQDLTNKTILLYAEQGFGDTLQFVRYAQILNEQFHAKVLVTCQPELRDLLKSVPGVATVITEASELPEFDYYCPLLSLPRVMNTSLDNIPVNIPYLHADPAQISRWQNRLPDDGTLKVGLVWAGNPRLSDPAASRVDRRRSIPLKMMATLASIPGITWVSLQKGTPSVELAASGFDMLDWTSDLHSFSDTATLVECLDLVISVDTSVVHLVGGLGRPIWMMSRFDSCWRWLKDRGDSPWYPSMRIFRQPTAGAWDAVIANVDHALRQLRS